MTTERSRVTFLVLALAGAALAFTSDAAAQTETVLYSFSGVQEARGCWIALEMFSGLLIRVDLVGSRRCLRLRRKSRSARPIHRAGEC
jgi:hypothetical protein